MAINPLNMLIEFANSKTLTLDVVKQGLGCTLAGDCFDHMDWEAMYHAESMSEVQEIAGILRPKYEARSFELGRPATAEEWQRAWLSQ